MLTTASHKHHASGEQLEDPTATDVQEFAARSYSVPLDMSEFFTCGEVTIRPVLDGSVCSTLGLNTGTMDEPVPYTSP